MVIAESLELTLGPSIQDPVLHTGPGRLGLVLGFVPTTLDLSDEAVLGIFRRVLGLGALLLEIGLQLIRIPLLIGGDYVRVPVRLHEVFEIFAVSRGGVRDVVVGEPSLELGLMPLVVRYLEGEWKSLRAGGFRSLPALENQELATVTSATSPREKRTVRILMMLDLS